eukprot:g610.t1
MGSTALKVFFSVFLLATSGVLHVHAQLSVSFSPKSTHQGNTITATLSQATNGNGAYICYRSGTTANDAGYSPECGVAGTATEITSYGSGRVDVAQATSAISATGALTVTAAVSAMFSSGDIVTLSGCTTSGNRGDYVIGTSSGTSIQLKTTANPDNNPSGLTNSDTDCVISHTTAYQSSAISATGALTVPAVASPMFSAGDIVTLSGCSTAANNINFVVSTSSSGTIQLKSMTGGSLSSLTTDTNCKISHATTYATSAITATGALTVTAAVSAMFSSGDIVTLSGCSTSANNINFVVSTSSSGTIQLKQTGGGSLSSLTTDSNCKISRKSQARVCTAATTGTVIPLTWTHATQTHVRARACTSSGDTTQFVNVARVPSALTLYSKKSECRVGGAASGALQACDAISGQTSYDCMACTSTSNSSSAETELDVYFNTNGEEGVVSCGAYGADYIGVPSTSIGQQIVAASVNALNAKNTITITSGEKSTDHVLNLNGLTAGTKYRVFCHISDPQNTMSARLDVHTNSNAYITQPSLTVKTTTQGASPEELYLTFTHGSALSSGNTIVLYPSGQIFTANGNTLCSATVSIVSQPQVTDYNTGSPKLTITLDAASTAGSKIVVTCTNNLANNPSGVTNHVTFRLDVSDHTSIYHQVGYTTA